MNGIALWKCAWPMESATIRSCGLVEEVCHCMGVLWRSPVLRLLIFVNVLSNIEVYRYIDSGSDDVPDVNSLPSCLQKRVSC